MITRSKMRRQLYRGGGIAGLYPRVGFGAGSWLKDKIRDLIPNELADVAVKAAPFVAPFNPGIAALMRGVGRFDQRGSISDALKQGALTYGGGQLVRQLGGAGVQKDFLGTPGDRLTTPLSQDRMEGLRNLFKAREKTPVESKDIPKRVAQDPTTMIPQLGSEQPLIDKIMTTWKGMSPGLRTAIVGTGSGAIAGVAQWFENQVPQEEGESTEEYLARRKVVVGKLMRQYLDNTRAYDAEWTGKTDEQKTDYISSINMNQGGRVGYQTGGITMANTLQENIRRNQAQAAANEDVLAAARTRMRGVPEQRTAQAPGILSQVGQALNPSKETVLQRLQQNQDNQISLADRINQHNDNNQLLRNALTAGKIDENQYKRMGGFDVAQQIPGSGLADAALVGGASTLYNAYKAGLNIKDPTNIDAQYGKYGPEQSIDLNIRGATGLNPTDLQLYNSIINDTYGTGPAIMERQNMSDVNKEPPKEIGERIYNLLNPEAATMADVAGPSQTEFPMPTNAMPNYEGGSMIGPNLYLGPTGIYEEFDGTSFTSVGRTDPRKQGLMASGGRVGLKHGTPEMGIKSLDAGAPDITYEGNEGPQAPQQMAGMMDQISLAFEQQNGYDMSLATPEVREIFIKQWMQENFYEKESRGPVLPSPEDPINPFAPKPTGPVLPDKMMAAKGGRIGQMIGTGPNGLPGIPRMAPDGMEFDMRQNGGFQPLGAKEKKDDVPAMLAKNEFVFTADAVRGAGDGDIEKGAQRMYDTMQKLEKRVV